MIYVYYILSLTIKKGADFSNSNSFTLIYLGNKHIKILLHKQK